MYLCVSLGCKVFGVYDCTNWSVLVQPIPLGVSFLEAQGSKLKRLFCHVSMKRDVRALSFEL